MPKKKTAKEFKKEMTVINSNIEILGEFINTKAKILVKCKTCNHEWFPAPRSLLQGNGCPECAKKSKTKSTKQFKEKMKIVNPNIEVIGEYINSKSYILVRNKICGHKWNTAKASSLLNGTDCPYCYGSKKKTTEEFKQELKIKNPYIEVLGEYINDATKILVRDKRCGHEWNTSNPNRLLKGQTCPKCNIDRKNKNQIKNNRIGEINYNKYGSKMTIINYKDYYSIDVKFENGYVTKNRVYKEFENGEIITPYDKTICNIGYLGEGNYNPTINGENTPQYYTWLSMMKRCYDKKQQEKQPSYKGCSVCEEWLCFQNYAKWWDENYYEVDGQRMEVDKDILHKGNKVYSPDNCIFVPQRINGLILKNEVNRGDYPIGVGELESGKFRARYSNALTGKRVHLGCFNTPEKAFEVYKLNKEKHVKYVADYYKYKIPKKLYDALYNWTIEITD